jgi:hypothetical protein
MNIWMFMNLAKLIINCISRLVKCKANFRNTEMFKSALIHICRIQNVNICLKKQRLTLCELESADGGSRQANKQNICVHSSL